MVRASAAAARSRSGDRRAAIRRIAPEYRGDSHYVDALAVRDRGVITASGLGPVEFAREIFEQLGVFSAADRPVWFHLFKHGRMPEPAA